MSRPSPLPFERRPIGLTRGLFLGGLALAAMGFLPQALAAQTPRPFLFVDDDAPPGGDGRSWSKPLRFLQDALTEAEEAPGLTRIFVAQGTYYPDRSDATPTGTGDRLATFQLQSQVEIRGGYAGYGAPNPTRRNLKRFVSILSGDIGVVGEPTDNSYSVVTGDFTDGTALLEGFRITAGRADGAQSPRALRRGGGLWCELGEPVIRHCEFVENEGFFGAGIYLDDSFHVVIEDCVFTRNQTLASNGAAIFSLRTQLELRSSRFFDNTSAVAGGAFQIQGGTVLVEDCSVDSNDAIGGAVNILSSGATPIDATLRRCSFINNRALSSPITNAIGGAMIINAAQSVVLEDCDFVNNLAAEEGGAVYMLDTAFARFEDCEFADNLSGISGGGLFVLRSNLELERARMERNTAAGSTAEEGGGAIYLQDASVMLVNCWVLQNETGGHGGGLRVWDNGTAILINTVLAGNRALQVGGAVAAESNVGLTNAATLLDCTLYANTSAVRGFEGLLAVRSQLSVLNSICWDNFPGEIVASGGAVSVTHSIVAGGYSGTGNLNLDPLLQSPYGPDGVAGTGDEDYNPKPTSPAVDTGDTSSVPVGITVDIYEQPRFVDGDGDGTADVDRGAAEYQGGGNSPATTHAPELSPVLRWSRIASAHEPSLDVHDPLGTATQVAFLVSQSPHTDERGLLVGGTLIGVQSLFPGQAVVPFRGPPHDSYLQAVFLDPDPTRRLRCSSVLAPPSLEIAR